MSVEPPIPAALWDSIPPVAQAAVLALAQAYEQRLAYLQQQVQDLQERLNQNSTNSSRPPSTDAPKALKRSPPKPPSGKPRGGQPGRAPQKRPPLPPDHALEVKPEACRRCGQVLQ